MRELRGDGEDGDHAQRDQEVLGAGVGSQLPVAVRALDDRDDGSSASRSRSSARTSGPSASASPSTNIATLLIGSAMISTFVPVPQLAGARRAGDRVAATPYTNVGVSRTPSDGDTCRHVWMTEGLQRQRDSSRLRILRTLLHRPPLSRAELGEALGLSRATVMALVAGPGVAGVSPAPADGRPPPLNRPAAAAGVAAANAAFAIGVDVGHRHVRVAVCDLAGSAPPVGQRRSASTRPRLTCSITRRRSPPTRCAARACRVGEGARCRRRTRGAGRSGHAARIHAAGMLPRWLTVDRGASSSGGWASRPDRQRRQRRRHGRVPVRGGARASSTWCTCGSPPASGSG